MDSDQNPTQETGQNSSDFDFSQLDQQVNKIMNQTSSSSSDVSQTGDQPKPSTNDSVSVKAAKPSQLPVKPRGYAMDVIHPGQSNMRAKPTQKPDEELALPEGDEHMLTAKATPDKITSGYGAGGFAAAESHDNQDEHSEQQVAQEKTVEDKIDNMPVASLSDEKDDFEDAVKQFADAPSGSTEPEATPPVSNSELDDFSQVDQQEAITDESNASAEEDPLDEIDSTPQTGALLANNLTNPQPGQAQADKSGERPAMFGSSDYVTPLKTPAKARKNNDKPWVVALIILLIVLIGLAASYYLLILQR